MALEEAEIGRFGERHVKVALEHEGWECHHDTKGPGSTDIEARSKSAGLLVQVKTGLHPNEPSDISSEERRNIVARATKLGCVAWQAKVQINGLAQLVGAIQWEKLT